MMVPAKIEVHISRGAYELFEVRIEGGGPDVLALRRQSIPHASQERGDGVLLVPVGRIRSVLAAVTPFLRRIGGRLVRDEATEQIIADLGAELASLRAATRGLLAPAAVDGAPGFRRPLTQGQLDAVRKLVSLAHGANFSVGGAGKTAVALAIHEILRATGKVDRLLVVCPRNAFRPWEEEIEACLGDSRRHVRLAGGDERIKAILGSVPLPDILLVSYQQLAFTLYDLERFCARQRCLHLVLDESHRIKRPHGGAWAAAVHTVGPLAARRDILTGTPFPNAAVDLASQLRFLWPYYTIIPEADLQAQGAEDTVRRRLRPVFVRVTKGDLALPRPRIVRQEVPLGQLQQRIHAAITDQAARESAGLDLRERANLARLRRQSLRLLQVASNPTLILHRADEFRLPPLDISPDSDLYRLFAQYADHEVPTKFLLAVDRVRTRAAQGRKTIVWTSFVHNLAMLERLLEDFQPVILHGGVPTAIEGTDLEEGTREALVSRFKTDPQCLVMLANPAACGESISLHTVCDYALYLDRTFNAGHFLQSMDRIHRLGLPPDAQVTYELLVGSGTIDETVHDRLEQKTRRLGAILEDHDLAALVLDVEEPTEEEEFDQDDAAQVMAFLLARTR